MFSGIGVLALAFFIEWLRRRSHSSPPQSATITAQGAKVTDSPVASGTGIVQTVNSPTINVSLPAPAPGTPGNERYNEWRELTSEIHESLQQMAYAFVPLNVITPGIEKNDYEAGIRRGYRVLRGRILIADVLKNAGMLENFQSIVEYAVSAHTPRDPSQRGCPTMTGFNIKASKFEDDLMELARRDSSSGAAQDDESLTPDERKAIKRKLAVSRINAWHPRLTVWIINRSDSLILVKSVGLWHGQKRLNTGEPSDNRKSVEVRPGAETGIQFVTDDDSMLKLQSLRIVDRNLPDYSSTDLDIEVSVEYEVLGFEDEFRETIRARVHGNREIESL